MGKDLTLIHSCGHDRLEWFDYSVPLPQGLTVGAIRRAIEYIERELPELVEIYHEQMNVFSAIVGIFGVRALDSVSNYEKHRNIDTAQQRGCAPRPSIDEATSHWREASRYLPMASDAHIENATRMQDA